LREYYAKLQEHVLFMPKPLHYTGKKLETYSSNIHEYVINNGAL